MYQLNPNGTVVRVEDGAAIPDDPRNADWQAYQAWLAAGNTPTPVPLGTLQAAQCAAIAAACNTLLAQGFISSALGAAHRYDAELEDQVNLIGAAVFAQDVPWVCTNQATGIRGVVPHTAAQMLQVFKDGAAYKVAMVNQSETLKAQVNAATTPQAVAAIVWIPPAT